MRLVLRMLVGAGILLALLVGGFVVNEAGNEVHYLCGNFRPGVTEQSVLTQLDTGNLLRYERTAASSGHVIRVDSLWDLGLHRCTIRTDDEGMVVHVDED